jgi:hypothetical protein
MHFTLAEFDINRQCIRRYAYGKIYEYIEVANILP